MTSRPDAIRVAGLGEQWFTAPAAVVDGLYFPGFTAADANLDSITAVVIGGTSLFGGRGIIVGSLLGALIVGVFRNGLALAGVDVLYQTLVVGVLVIVAVSTDQWIRRVRA